MLVPIFDQETKKSVDVILKKYEMKPVFANHILKDLCTRFLQILFNHHMILRYHQTHDRDLSEFLLKNHRPALIKQMDSILAGKVLPFFKQYILENFNMRQLFDFLNVLGLMIKIFQELTVNEMPIKVD